MNSKIYKTKRTMNIVSFLLLLAAILSLGLMSWLFREKKEEAVFKKLKLLPRWFKFIGLAIAVGAAVGPWIFECLLVDGKNYLGAIYMIFGLSLICFSRDKTEDEMSNLIRLKSFYRSIGLGLAGFFFLSYLENNVSDGFERLSADTVVFIVLVTYLANYYITKSKIRSAE